MNTGAIEQISQIVSNATGQDMLLQQVGMTMLSKTMNIHKQQANAVLYEMLPASSVTPHVGGKINTYA